MEMEISNSLARLLQYTWVFTVQRTAQTKHNMYLNTYYEYTALIYWH